MLPAMVTVLAAGHTIECSRRRTANYCYMQACGGAEHRDQQKKSSIKKYLLV